MNVKYPVSEQNFRNLRNNGYLYVDKTAYIHRLANPGGYFFLSRPRRFGKSLILNCFYTGYLTIKAYDPEYQEFTLGYPNTEVRTGFFNSLLQAVKGWDYIL